MMQVKCPKCKNIVVWKCTLPKDFEYTCQKCKHQWSMSQSIKEIKNDIGNFIGYWDGKTIECLREAIEGCCNKLKGDWNLFKGKKIYTAWRESKPEEFIVVHNISQLAYFLKMSTNNENWYKVYLSL